MNDFYKQIFLTAISKFLGEAVGIIALVWWCVLYPELCFPRETYEAVYETQENDVLEKEISGVYPEILQADDDKIVISSRLLEWLKQKID